MAKYNIIVHTEWLDTKYIYIIFIVPSQLKIKAFSYEVLYNQLLAY